MTNKAGFSLSAHRFLSREFWYGIAYLVLSAFVFSFFFRNPQNVMGDSSHYWSLSSALMERKLDVLHFNFEMRTYVHPLYLAVARAPAAVLGLSQEYAVYIFNFILFLLTNYFIYLRVRTFDAVVARVFLLLSSFNVFTLGFVNTNLTENISIFFTGLLFYLLTGEEKIWKAFGAGVVAGLFMYTRPSAMVLFFALLVMFLVKSTLQRNIKSVALFVMGGLLPISIGMLNTYNIEQRFALFTSRTQGIYEMQVVNGPRWIKYETSADRTLDYPTLFFTHTRNDKFMEIPCSGTVACIVTYFKTYPVDYVMSLAHHIFNIFDRVYVNTYITNLEGRGMLLSFVNYFLLTSVFLGCLFFKYNKQWVDSLRTIALITLGLISIYVPTIVEPRFSAPVYPFIFLLFCYYLFQMFKSTDMWLKLRLLCVQAAFIILCFLLSDLVSITVMNGTEKVY